MRIIIFLYRFFFVFVFCNALLLAIPGVLNWARVSARSSGIKSFFPLKATVSFFFFSSLFLIFLL